jgi:surfeit locus 1 family protein
MQELRFQPRLIPTLATLCLLGLFVYLGLWQAGKGERLLAERTLFAARAKLGPLRISSAPVEPAALRDAPIIVRGRYEPEQGFFIDNRQENGHAGLHVVTPLKIEGGETRILVNRGWVGWPHGRRSLPEVLTPEGVVEVSGIADVPVVKKFLLMPQHAEARTQLWMQMDLKRFSQQVPYAVQPVVLLQNSADAQDGLIRNWQAPEDRVSMHQSYALQWFGMAAALLVFYGYASISVKERTFMTRGSSPPKHES